MTYFTEPYGVSRLSSSLIAIHIYINCAATSLTAILVSRFMLNLQRVKVCTENGGESSISSVGSLSFRNENTGRLGSIGSVLQPEDFLADDREEAEETTTDHADEAVGIELNETSEPMLIERMRARQVDQEYTVDGA